MPARRSVRDTGTSPTRPASSFNAHLSDTGEGPFLRTGDLGFMREGQLYVTGRLDDLIIVRGLNRYPQDIEATARGSHPLLEAGYGAAFVVDDHGRQRLVLVQEVARNGRGISTPVLDAVRRAVLDEHGLALDAIVLVRSGTIPKTSSGKVQRHACRAAFLAGELKALAEYRGLPVDNAAARIAGAEDAGSSTAHPAPHSSQAALAAVCQHARALAGAALPDLTPDTPLTALGLDSLQRLELAARLEKTFAGHLPDTVFSQAQTLGDLVQAVQKHLIDGPKPDVPAGQIPPEHYDFARFPEYGELKRQERMLLAVAGDNPYFRVDQGGAGSAPCIEGRQLVNFSVYDYIGLAHDPEVAAAAKAAIDRYGTSAGASRLVSGEKQVHRDLEQALAAFLGTPAAIVFVSGHATNVTTIGHLLGPDDLILHDILAHNSIIQGAMLSGATRRAFAHNDWRALDTLLSEVRHRYRRVLIAIEGVYSMDGDFPELPRFVELKKKHKTLLLVDEAHSLGTMGATGRGIGEHWGVARADVDLWMGTLSKSLASCGGYIAGSAELVEYLKYTAPGFVYSVGMSPPNAAAALAALTVLQREPQRVARLRELAALFLKLARERGLNTGSAAGTPVIPVIVGSSVKSLRLSRALFERGINVQPILHPAVPDHSARLRFFITTNHSEAQIRATVNAVADELAKLQRRPSEKAASRSNLTNRAEHVIEVEKLTKRYGRFAGGQRHIVYRQERRSVRVPGPERRRQDHTVEIIETIRTPTSGKVRLLGMDVTKKKHDIVPRIGVLPQGFSSFDRITVRETIQYYSRLFCCRHTDVDGLIELANLKDKATEQYKNLSGGLKQRLGIAIALVNDPEVVFLDEPTTGSTPAHGARCGKSCWA